MNKITTGLIGLVATVGIVAGTAYAIFTSQVTISGFQLKTGTAALQIKPDLAGYDFGPSMPIPWDTFKVLLPGTIERGVFWLKNNSDAGTTRPEDFDLALTGQLISVEGDWGDLKDLIFAEVFVEESPSETTGWHKLSEWNSSSISLPGGVLGAGLNRKYNVRFYLDSAADNTVAGKKISNVTIEFTGTQVL